jgi:hypothetical protein
MQGGETGAHGTYSKQPSSSNNKVIMDYSSGFGQELPCKIHRNTKVMMHCGFSFGLCCFFATAKIQ